MENNKKIFDAQGNEVKLSSADFEFCQVDKKIHDTKFETKATTFAKDAFKRFCKNKSSVVGAFIIGFLVLLSVFVPVFNKHDIEKPNIAQRFLEPKLFETGTGFWDGTKEVKNIPYNPNTNAPAGYAKNAVVEVIATEKGNELGGRPSSPIYTDRSTMERKNSLGEIAGPTLVKRR